LELHPLYPPQPSAKAGFHWFSLVFIFGLTSRRSALELPSHVFTAEDKGLEPSPQLSSRSALAVQCSKPISTYPPCLCE